MSGIWEPTIVWNNFKTIILLYQIYKTENLGEILRGDRISNTAYKVKMKTGVECQILCDKKSWDAKASSEVSYR